MRLVRGNSGLQRQNSGSSTSSHTSPRQTSDALKRPYFNKYSNLHSLLIQNDRVRSNSAQDKLHNRSLRNLNDSKSLFEQKLEQQHKQLLDQQKRALDELNEAWQKDRHHGEDDSVSLCSADSLDGSAESKDENPGRLHQQNDDNHLQNERVIHTKSSLQDTHQSVRDISFHLNSAYEQSNGLGYMDRNEKIDSYSVDQPWNNNNNNNYSPSSVAVSKPEVQRTQGSEVKERPKVQLRAWSTPSPVDAQHSAVSNAHMTNNNPYSSRPSMTAVTSTTTYASQRNGWKDENQLNSMNDRTVNGGTGSQNQNVGVYSDTVNMDPAVRNITDVNRGYTNGYLYTSENSKSAQPSGNGNKGQDSSASRPMEFLQSVTNAPENTDRVTTNSDRVTNTDKVTVTESAPETRPSRVPRPVSAVRIQKVQYTVIPPPSSNQETIQAPSGVQATDKGDNGKNGVVQKTETVSNNKQVFINTTSGDRPQVRQVTQVKFAASVVNGGVNVSNYGKMNVQPLPNKPVVLGVSELKKENSQTVATVTRKTKDDADLVVRHRKEAEEEVNSGVKGILKRPGAKLKKAGSTGSVNSMDVKDSIEIARVHMHHHQHHSKQVIKAI